MYIHRTLTLGFDRVSGERCGTAAQGCGLFPLKLVVYDLPVLCSGAVSAAEAVSQAGLLIDPPSIDEVVLPRVVSDEILRKGHGMAGPARVTALVVARGTQGVGSLPWGGGANAPRCVTMSVCVAIDVTTAVTQRAGVARYTREVVRALVALPDGPELCAFFVAPRAAFPLDAGPAPVGIHRRMRSWRMEILLRHLLKRPVPGPWDGAQLYHAPDVVYPPTHGLPVVTTVHDLSYVIYPQYHTRLNGTYLRWLTPLATQGARLVIAVSASTKRDLVERLGVPEQKVRVVHPGVAAIFTRPPEPERVKEVRQRYGLTDAFILSVGTLEPRKNLAGTLQAYRMLHERLAGAPPLVLVGGSGWGLSAQRLLGVREDAHIRGLGYVPDEDLAALYASCSAFVYPSFYEGWGSPVGEALALGAPTVTSNVSSLPEVAGDAALLVDPHSPEAIAAALERILIDTPLSTQLRVDGPTRARQFSVQLLASATMRVYLEAVAG